ncbi:hypothetical protein CMV_026986, partial [Castanea mollissima]
MGIATVCRVQMDSVHPLKFSLQQVTRSIGDDDLKPAVTAEPEMTETDLSGEDEFLSFANDRYSSLGRLNSETHRTKLTDTGHSTDAHRRHVRRFQRQLDDPRPIQLETHADTVSTLSSSPPINLSPRRPSSQLSQARRHRPLPSSTSPFHLVRPTADQLRPTPTHADQPSRPQTHAVQALNSLKTLSSSLPISPLSSNPRQSTLSAQ